MSYAIVVHIQAPQKVDMNQMTLPSKHRIQNSSSGDLRPATLPIGHKDPGAGGRET